MPRECYASPLGGCQDKQSAEHVVSKSIWTSQMVRCKGLPWCRDSEKEISVASFTHKNLCEWHNSILSPVDRAGAEAFKSLTEASRLCNVRQRLTSKGRYLSHKTIHINGTMLERWFGKTLINMAQAGQLPEPWFIEGESPTAKVPDALLRCVFGLDHFGPHAGLHTVAAVGDVINSQESIGFCPMFKDGPRAITGGLFEFRGIRFYFHACDFPFPENPGIPASVGAPWAGGSYLRHHPEITFNLNGIESHSVVFDWGQEPKTSRS